MLIKPRLIDDFKTDRKDILPPLPDALRAVPILFYLLLLASLGLGAVLFLRLQAANATFQSHELSIAQLEQQAAGIAQKRQALEAQILRAQDVEKWVASSMPLQPVVVEITRSLGEETGLESLRLDRLDLEGPQVRLELALNTRSASEIDQVSQSLEKASLRIFSPKQDVKQDVVLWETILAWPDLQSPFTNNSGEASTPPAP